jgi:hypothetical protein
MLAKRISQTVDSARAYAQSPAGRQVRRAVGTALIIGSPLVFRLPGFRRHPALRIAEVLGGAALLVAVGERLRDWEPGAESVRTSN